MITKLNLNLPINSLSLGQCSYNILKELYKRKIQVALFLKGQLDLAAFKNDPTFFAWIEQSIINRFKKLDRKIPTLAVWHINDSQFKPSDKQFLFSFHETDQPTEHELNIVAQQENVFFSSSWTVDNFKTYGASNVSFIPLGLDDEFYPPTRRIVSPEITHWILVGKTEARKNTELIIRTWIKKYGGNRAHRLTLCITNPFFQPQQMDGFYNAVFNGVKPNNVSILPRLKTNIEMNQLYGSADIDLSGFSNSEGFNLPSFTATAIGKWSIVTNCTAHKDWANNNNSILVEQNGSMKPCYDNVFFRPGEQFSQGNIYNFTEDQLLEAMSRAEIKYKVINSEGLKLKDKFNYKNTVDKILEKIETN